MTGSMREARFALKVKDGTWTHHPRRWAEDDARMLGFTLVALRDGHPLGGHNIQAHLGTPSGDRAPAHHVDLELPSGWWVSFRNQFAQAPDVAAQIVGSVEEQLSTVTAELERARGQEMSDAQRRLWATTFHASGPNYWR